MQTQAEIEYEQAVQNIAVPPALQAERNTEDQDCRIAYPDPTEHNVMIAARNRRRAAADAAEYNALLASRSVSDPILT